MLSTAHHRLKLWPILGLFLLALSINLLSYSLWGAGLIGTTETGSLELAQSIFLAIACLLHSYHSRNSNTCTVTQYLHVGLALFCFGLLLRELDVDKMGHAEDADMWGYLELTLRALALGGFVIYGGLLLKHPRLKLPELKKVAGTPALIITLCGCVCYLSSWPFDKLIFPIPVEFSSWAEESLELTATLLVLAAACTKPFGHILLLLPNFVHDSRR